MSLAPIFYVVQSPATGAAISGATVTVLQHPSNTPAVLYQDEAGTTPIPTPTDQYVTDSAGRATYGGNQLWVAAGRYNLTVSGSGLTSYTVVRDFFSTQHQHRVQHSWTVDDQTSPLGSVTRLGSFTVSYSSQEVGTLYGVYHRCEKRGSSITGGADSIFQVLTDHASHGTFVAVTGLTAINPNTGPGVLVQPTGGPMTLAEGDTVIVVASTPGNTQGYQIDVIEERTFP